MRTSLGGPKTVPGGPSRLRTQDADPQRSLTEPGRPAPHALVGHVASTWADTKA